MINRKSKFPSPASRPSRPAILAKSIVALVALGFGPCTVQGQTWTSTGSADWNTATNWNPAAVPNGSGATATFDGSGVTTLSLSANTEVDGITFTTAAAAPYTVIASPLFSLTISGAGISNSSGVTQNLVAAVNGSAQSGNINFTNSATASGATITNQGAVAKNGSGAFTTFLGTSTAGNAVINSQAATASGVGGYTYFQNSSAAGNATITNQGAAINTHVSGDNLGSFTYFSDNSTAGNASITNNGSTVSGGSGAYTDFISLSTGADATITSNGSTVSGGNGGYTQFVGPATAGNATLITNGGSNGGAGGQTNFYSNADGGTARAITNGNGVLDISGLTSGGMKIGSIEGSGTYFLGKNTLTVGGNNLSTTVSGVIADGGPSGGTGGSLVKTGTGTLTLTGKNTYKGTTTVNEGILQMGTAGAAGMIAGGVVNLTSGGTFELVNVVGGTLANHVNGTGSGGTLNVDSANQITLSGLLTDGGAGQLALTQTGAGTTILTNAGNTYTGTTTVSSGTLQLGTTAAASKLNAGSLIALNSGGVFSLVNVSGGTLANNFTNGVSGIGTLSINSANVNTLSGALTDGLLGQLTLTQSGSKTTILTNAGNTYSGATTVSKGILQIGTTTVGGSLGASSAVSVGQGGTLTVINVHGNLLANNITNGLGGTGLVTVAGPGAVTLGGSLSSGAGSLALTQSGTGTTTLTGNNTYTGATTVSAGTLQVGDGTAGNLTTATVVTVSGSGALATDLASGATFVTNVNLGTATAALKAIQSTTNTLSCVVGGTGVFDQNGAGTTILTGANTFTGATNVNAGTLQVDGSLAAGSTVNVTTGGTLTGMGTIHGKATLTGQGIISLGTGGTISGTLGVTGGNWTGLGSVSGVVTSSSGNFNITDNLTALAGVAVTGGTIGGAGKVTGNLNYTSSAGSVFGGTIADGMSASTVTMNKAASTLTLTGTNGYTGTTTISAGTLQLGDGSTTGSSLGSGSVTASGTGTLALNLPEGSTFTRNITVSAAGATVKTIQAGTNTLSGVISGLGGMNQNGTGTTIVTGAETYTGVTSVTTGTLQVDGSLAAGSTVNVAAAGTLAGAGTVAGTVNVLAGGNLNALDKSGPGTLTVGKLVLNAGSNSNFSFGAPGAPGNDLINVTGNLTIAGNLNITALPGFGQSIGSYTLFTYGGTLTNTGFSAVNGTGGFTTAVSTATMHQVNLVVSGTAVTQYRDGTGAVSNGVISGGSGTWNNSTNNWTDSAGASNTTWQGGTAVFNAPGGAVNLGAPLNAQGLIFGGTGYSIGGSFGLNLVGTAGMVPTISVTDAGTMAAISAPLTGNAGMTSSGAGTLILANAANTYTGGTNISAGVVQIGTTAAAGSVGGGTISIASGGTLTLVNTHGNLLANNITNGVATIGTLIVNSTLANTLSGTLTDGTTGTLALTQSGTGTTILTNASNNFSGATTISKGTLQIGTATAAGSLGPNTTVSVGAASTLSLVNVAGNLFTNNISDGASGTGLVSINSTTNFTLSGALTNGAGTLALTKAGTGTTTLSGADTYTGATTVSAGTLQIGGGTTTGATLGSGSVTTAAAGTLTTDLANGETFANNVTDTGHIIATGTTNNYTVSGIISGTGNFTKTGANTVTVTGANTYKGGTAVSAGTLLVNNTTGSGTGSGVVTVNKTATLGGSGTIIGAVTLNSGGTIAPSAGTPGSAGTTLHATSLMWNGGGTLQLQLGATGDELVLTGALTKGTAGVYTLNLTDATITQTSYTLATFASTTFAQANFNLELPAGDTGTLVETATSLMLTMLHVEEPAGDAIPPTPSVPELPGDSFSSFSLRSDSPASSSDLSVTPTPEPTSVLLLAFGGAALLGWRRRRRVA